MSFPGDENTQQDANQEASSLPQESNDSESTSAQAQASPEPETQSKSVPFHEDPKVQEYVERQIRKQTESYEQRMSELQRQYQETLSRVPTPEKPKNPFISKLGEIDPAYEQTMQEIYNKANSVDEIKQELAAIKQEAFVNSAVSQINNLHEKNKVSSDLRGLYNESIEAAYRSGNIKNLQDVQRVYKDVHEKYSKVFDSVKRAERASYVTDKSKDAQTPTSQPKGKAATRNEKGQFTGDWEQDRATIVARAMKRAKASSDL